MAFDDPVAEGEPQPCSLSRGLGREKGFEDPGADLGRPRVGNLERDPPLRRIIPGGESEATGRASLPHGVVGVGHEIDHHLLELVGISQEGGKIVCEVKRHLHVVQSEGIDQKVQGLSDDLIEIRRLVVGRVLPRQCDEVFHNARAARQGEALLQREQVGEVTKLNQGVRPSLLEARPAARTRNAPRKPT